MISSSTWTTVSTPAVKTRLGYSQYHLAVAGGCMRSFWIGAYGVPTRYREVVLTVSKKGDRI